MDTIASYLLCREAGLEPSKENISKVLGSITDNISENSINEFIEKIEGKSFEQIIADGSALMVTQVTANQTSASANNGEVKEEKQEEEEEEEEDDLDFADLF